MKIKQVLNSVNTKHIRRLLKDHYHKKGPGRTPINPPAMLKAQLLKHLLRIPSDRRLTLRLKHDTRTARACGFKKHTPSHGLFTHFRHRLGEETYNRIFNQLLRRLLEEGVVRGNVIAVDSTHLDAYSQLAPDNSTGKSDLEARVGRGGKSFYLGYCSLFLADIEGFLGHVEVPTNLNEPLLVEHLLDRVLGENIELELVAKVALYDMLVNL